MMLLEARSVTKLFGSLRAVDAVDLTLAAGEVVGLIGPNGAGKSTLVNLISGLERPTSGTLVFAGHPLQGEGPAARARQGIARTFQVPQSFGTMRVRQNVAVAALFRGQPAASVPLALREADEVLEFVGLTAKADAVAETLTTPDLRRLELAKALALRPRLLLLDEVMAGLTPAEVNGLIAVVRDVGARGVGVLVIEHVLRAVMGLCSRIVVLHHGQKIADGARAEVVANPAVIQAYLGVPYGAAA